MNEKGKGAQLLHVPVVMPIVCVYTDQSRKFNIDVIE